MAFDNGIFSFSDQPYSIHSDNVVILITNPKDSLFITNHEDQMDLIKRNQIRVLIFSDSEIEKVEMEINGNERRILDKAGSNLFTAKWNPKKYESGLHLLEVKVTLRNGNLYKKQQFFSFDGSHKDFSTLASFALMVDWVPASMYMFIFACSSIVIVLALFRTIHKFKLRSQVQKIRLINTNCIVSLFWKIIRKFWILSALDSIYYTLIAFVIYMSFLPWNLAYVLDNQLAIVFSWAILVLEENWNFDLTPANMTFFYGTVAMAFYFLPLIIILAFAVDNQFVKHQSQKSGSFIYDLFLHFCMIILLGLQFRHAFIQGRTYGLISSLGPFGIGWFVISVVLYWKCWHLKKYHFRYVDIIWS